MPYQVSSDLGSALIGHRPVACRISVGMGTKCFPSAVPELRMSTLKQAAFVLTSVGPLPFETSCNGLPLFWERLRSRPVLNPPLLLIDPKFSRPVARRGENTIKRYHSRQIGAWRSQKSILRSRRTKTQPRQ